MRTMALNSRSACFALGAASAWAIPWAYRALRKRLGESDRESIRYGGDNDDSKSTAKVEERPSTSNTTANKTQIMDAVDLDLRMIRKAEGVIRYRTSGITIVIERCTNDWNYSAILRTAEALGIQNVFIVDPPTVNIETDSLIDGDEENGSHAPAFANDAKDTKAQPKMPTVLLTKEELASRRAHHLFAQNATDWLTITNFTSTQECIDALRATDHTIWATDLSQEAVPLTVSDLTQAGCWPVFPKKLAIVFGTEAVGVTQIFLEQADRRVYLPLYGFADSLNLSVATALVVFAILQLEPRYVAFMSEEERHDLRSLWFPKLAQQRLLTGSQKKRRNKLISHIGSCKLLEEKQRRYEQQKTKDGGNGSEGEVLFPLTNEQSIKLDKLQHLQQELLDLEESVGYHTGSAKAVAGLIENPPDPLTDLRRIDQHRICFVGKNTKSLFKEAWKGLAATTTKSTGSNAMNCGSTAAFFRRRAQIDGYKNKQAAS